MIFSNSASESFRLIVSYTHFSFSLTLIKKIIIKKCNPLPPFQSRLLSLLSLIQILRRICTLCFGGLFFFHLWKWSKQSGLFYFHSFLFCVWILLVWLLFSVISFYYNCRCDLFCWWDNDQVQEATWVLPVHAWRCGCSPKAGLAMLSTSRFTLATTSIQSMASVTIWWLTCQLLQGAQS